MELPEKTGGDRDFKMLELRKKGLLYREIAQTMEVAPSTAYNGVKRALRIEAARYNEETGSAGYIMLEQLDYLLRQLVPFIRAGKITAPDGATYDAPPNMDAVDRYLKVLVQKSKLLGLDKDVIQFESANSGAPSVASGNDQTEMTPGQYAKAMFREIIAAKAMEGPEVEAFRQILGDFDEEILDVESEEVDISDLVQVPSLTAPKPEDDAPAWVDDDDYTPSSTDWVPNELPEVDDEMPEV